MAEIPVRFIGGEMGVALCSDEDYEYLSQFRWDVNKGGYATRRKKSQGKTTTWFMAREVLGLKHGDPLHSDHINGNRLDNRRENLRVVTAGQNKQNVSGRRMQSQYRGVRRGNSKTESWVAFAHVQGRFVHIGTFKTEIEAARAASDFRAVHLPFSVEERHVACGA